jgi:hypothetical protein
VWEAKKKLKIFLGFLEKKLCHVVEHIFLSNFVMHRKIPSHHLPGAKWVWSFFFKRLFFHMFLWLWGPSGPHFHHRRWWIRSLNWSYISWLSFGHIPLILGL